MCPHGSTLASGVRRLRDVCVRLGERQAWGPSSLFIETGPGSLYLTSSVPKWSHLGKSLTRRQESWVAFCTADTSLIGETSFSSPASSVHTVFFACVMPTHSLCLPVAFPSLGNLPRHILSMWTLSVPRGCCAQLAQHLPHAITSLWELLKMDKFSSAHHLNL